MIDWMAPGMPQVVGFGHRSMGRGNFGHKYGTTHCNQWGLCGIAVQNSGITSGGNGDNCLRAPAKKEHQGDARRAPRLIFIAILCFSVLDKLMNIVMKLKVQRRCISAN